MSTRSRKRSLGTEHNEINLALKVLKSGSSTSAKRQRNTKDPIIQSFRSNEIAETSLRSLLNEISTNMLEDPFNDAECGDF
ncbi:41041_t:CDS:2 [Gigaspora margarita]|uniref:41041_t:CDS:1 n=1 Tax=Gigaspora margarita TaxID=4874 RepID=A0ABM8VXZ2_GIGMA|nr:41041_t:CDS:2 [Gigaspora margarita]